MSSNRVDMTGQTFGLLTVQEYHHSDEGGAFWVATCVCGTTKVYARRNLTNDATQDCGDRTRHGDRGPRYSTVHNRLMRQRGKASEHDCVDCGEQAREWSFDRPTGFSMDLERYAPRCRSCHNAQRSELVSA